MNQRRNDPDLYAKLSTPHPRAECEASLNAFMDGLLKLRIKHGICDVVIGATARSIEEGSDPGLVCHYGNGANAIPMAAMVLRHFRAIEDQRIEAMTKPSRGEPIEVHVPVEAAVEALTGEERDVFLDARAIAVEACLPATLGAIVQQATWKLEPGPAATTWGMDEAGALSTLKAIGAVEEDGVWRTTAGDDPAE